MKYIFKSKANTAVHILDEDTQKTLCRLEMNPAAFRALDLISEFIPSGRRVCGLCSKPNHAANKLNDWKLSRVSRKQELRAAKRLRRKALRAARRNSVEVKQPKGMSWKEYSHQFYSSEAWKTLRYKALTICGARCLCCGRSARDGVVMHVDHIKPRWTHKHLELEITNLQVLCDECNLGKRASDDTDWRSEEMRQQMEHMASIVGTIQ